MSAMLFNFSKITTVAAFISAGLLMSGCSDKEKPENPKPTAAAEIKPEVKAVTPATPSLAERGVTLVDPPASPAKDIDFYRVSTGLDVLYLFGANAPGGVDLKSAIGHIYTNYGDLSDKKLDALVKKYNDGDQFVKNDTAKEIGPVLQENAAKLSGKKYVVTDVQGPLSLGAYDFERHGYIVTNALKDKAGEDGTVPYSRPALRYSDVIGYKLSFINAFELSFIEMPEDSARKLNEYMKQGNLNFRLYGYLQSVAEDKSEDQRYVVMKIQKVELTSSTDSGDTPEVFYSYSI
ncbi:hypothetical protein ACOAN3_14720 [Pseudomonas aeruginosa]|nr:hypothetical protein [Pseudomonas aeruginosa]